MKIDVKNPDYFVFHGTLYFSMLCLFVCFFDLMFWCLFVCLFVFHKIILLRRKNICKFPPASATIMEHNFKKSNMIILKSKSIKFYIL